MTQIADQPLSLSSTLLMILICAILGGAFTAIKIGLLDMPPLGSAALRFFLTGMILFAWTSFQGIPLRCQWPAVQTLTLLMFLFTYMNYTIYTGTSLTTSGRATVFFYTQPLFLALLAHYFLPDDRLTVRKISGLVLALFGLAVLFFTKLSTGHPPTHLGDSLVLTGALSFALQNLVIKRVAGRIHPVVIILWSSLGCAFVLGGYWWLFERPASFVFSQRAILSLLYLSLISGAFAFVGFAWLLQNHSATRVNALIFLAPVFGILFGALLLQESPTSLQFLGMAGICLGVYIVTSSQTPQRQTASSDESSGRE